MVNLLKKHVIFLTILLIAGYLRFNNISSVTTVGGDQGYDFLQIYKMVAEKNLTLLGPKIGPYNDKIGNLYLGPAYYYLLTPSLVLSNFDPVGPALLTALSSVFTMIFIYIIACRFLNPSIGILAVLIFGFSPLAIRQSQAASNPHLLPFFGALIVFGILNARRKANSILWSIIIGLACGISFQLHYLAFTIFLVSLVFLFKDKRRLLVLVLSFVAAVLPQILFEFKHSFFVTNLFIAHMFLGESVNGANLFFSQLNGAAQTMMKFFLGVNLIYFLPILVMVLIKLLIAKNKLPWPKGQGIFFLARLALRAKRARFGFQGPQSEGRGPHGSAYPWLESQGFPAQNNFRVATVLNIGVCLSSLFAAAMYSGGFGIHYLAVAYPSFVLLLAAIFYYAWKTTRNSFLKIGLGIIFAQIVAATILTLDLSSEQGYTMPQGWNLNGLRKASEIVALDANHIFNVTSVLDGDSRAMPLRYMVTTLNKVPAPVENYSTLDSLYLLTKDDNERVYNYTVWEVSNYQPFEITQSWEIQNNVRLLKLVKKNDGT